MKGRQQQNHTEIESEIDVWKQMTLNLYAGKKEIIRSWRIFKQIFYKVFLNFIFFFFVVVLTMECVYVWVYTGNDAQYVSCVIYVNTCSFMFGWPFIVHCTLYNKSNGLKWTIAFAVGVCVCLCVQNIK